MECDRFAKGVTASVFYVFSERVSCLSSFFSFSKVSKVVLLYYSVVLKFDDNCIRSIRIFTSSGPFAIL